MPRRASDNTESVNINLPDSWLKRAQKLADQSNKRAMIGKLTRADVLRAALSLGLLKLEEYEKQVAPIAMGRLSDIDTAILAQWDHLPYDQQQASRRRLSAAGKRELKRRERDLGARR